MRMQLVQKELCTPNIVTRRGDVIMTNSPDPPYKAERFQHNCSLMARKKSLENQQEVLSVVSFLKHL